MSEHDDLGWVDLAAAQLTARRLRRRTKLRCDLRSIELLIPTLVHSFDQASNAAGGGGLAIGQCQIGLIGSEKQGAINDLTILAVNGGEQAEEQLLEGVELVLQLLDRVGVGMRHGLFSLRHAGEASPASDAGHRLSEVAK